MSENTTLINAALAFWRLLWQLGLRDIQARYKGSVLGILWALITPLLMVLLYTYLFSVVFQSQWGEDLRPPQARQVVSLSPREGGAHAQYALVLFSGLLLHSFLAEVMTRSCAVVVSQANLVKKVVFPLHVLPAVVVFSALFQTLISAALLLVGVEFSFGLSGYGWLFGSWITLPILLVPLVLWGLGLAWLLAALGVFLRDLSQLMGWLVTALLFSAPVLYPLSNLPQPYRHWLYLNPLTWVVETWRHVIYWGAWPDWGAALGFGLSGALIACWGAWCFERMKRGFADVL